MYYLKVDLIVNTIMNIFIYSGFSTEKLSVDLL